MDDLTPSQKIYLPIATNYAEYRKYESAWLAALACGNEKTAYEHYAKMIELNRALPDVRNDVMRAEQQLKQ